MKKFVYVLIWGLLLVVPVARADDSARRQQTIQKQMKKNAKSAQKSRNKQLKALAKWKKNHGA
jgi:hypothetical protein